MPERFKVVTLGKDAYFKGALNLNFLNLTIRREKFWLWKRFGPIS